MKISRIFEITASILFLAAASVPAAQMSSSDVSNKDKGLAYGIQERGTTAALATTHTQTTNGVKHKKATDKALTRGTVGPNGECICPPKVKKAGTRGVTQTALQKKKVMHHKTAPATAPKAAPAYTGQCPTESSYSESRGIQQQSMESRGIEQQPIQEQPVQPQPQSQSYMENQSTEKVWSDQNASTRGISPTCNEQVSTRGMGPKYRNHWFQFWRPKAPATYSHETVTTTRGVEKTRNHWFQFWRPKAPASESSMYSTSTSTRSIEEQPVQPAPKHHMFGHKKQPAPVVEPSPAAPMQQNVEQPSSTRAVAPNVYKESCPTGASAERSVSRGPTSQDYGRGGAFLDNPRENHYYPEQPSLRRGEAATRGTAAKGGVKHQQAPMDNTK